MVSTRAETQDNDDLATTHHLSGYTRGLFPSITVLSLSLPLSLFLDTPGIKHFAFPA